ncbi:MAG TPA: PIN domain-containing protein, partial [Taishania sp.]|nr:PIN domain-containing protein [Taishania sp.]
MVVSEFANVLLRRDYNQWITNNKFVDKDFKKDFVGIKEYENSVETITISINKIFKLPNLVFVGDNFNAIDKSAILKNFKKVDFNDAYYAQLAILNKYKVVTNDKDYQKLDLYIDIITTQV